MFYKFRGNYRKQIDSANITNPIFSSKIYFLSRSFLSFRFFSVDARAGITLDEKMQGSKEERERRRTREMQSWSRRSRLSKKEGRVHGVREKGIERSGASGLETRVMAFLVLSCVRTLTLLAHIRAWSWLLSAFLHGAASLFSRPLSLRFFFCAREKPDHSELPLNPPPSLCSIDRRRRLILNSISHFFPNRHIGMKIKVKVRIA